MAVNLKRKSWWVDFRFNHTRYRIKSPQNTRASALAYEAHLRSKLARGETLDAKAKSITSEINYAKFIDQWFEQYVIPNNKPSEQHSKLYILTSSLIPFFGKMEVSKISHNDIERYKASLGQTGITNKTINNRLIVLRKSITCAYEWLELEGFPPKIKPLKTAPPKTNYLSLVESERILTFSKGDVHELLLLALRTGMRQGEIRGLQWESIDFDNCMIAVRHSQSDYSNSLTSPKSNRERYIPFDVEVHEMLLARRLDTGYVFTKANGRPIDNSLMVRMLKKVRLEAGLREFGWHTLRHTFATQLTINGTPLTHVQVLLGHSTIAMTMRYSHLSPNHLKEAIYSLSGPNLGKLGNGWSTKTKQIINNV